MAEKSVRVFRSKKFKNWYNLLTPKEKRIVDARIDLAREQGIFIKIKSLDKKCSLYEFKWKSGLRVYFSLLQDENGNFVLLLAGGNKNSQKEDITEAKNIINKVIKSIEEKQEPRG